MNNRLTSYQSAALMLCFTLARLIAYRPSGDSLAVTALAEAVSCIGMFIICLPAVKLPSAGKLGDKLLAFIYAAYCLFALTVLLTDFAGAMQYSFPNFYSSAAIVVALAAAAAYCASMGLSGCAKAACAAVVLTLAAFALMTAGACSGFSFERLNIAVPDRGEQFKRSLFSSFAYTAELPLLISLMRRRTSKPVKAAGLYFALRALLWIAALTVCSAVLGDYAVTGQPFWSLAAFAKTSVIERFDALILLFWTLCTLLSAAALLICFKLRVDTLFPNLSRYSLVAAVLPAGASLAFTHLGIARPAIVIPAAAAALGAAAAAFGKRRAEQ